MAYEQTCVLIKPHIVEGEDAIAVCMDIVSRYTAKGLAILDARCFRMDENFIHQFYVEHIGRDYFMRDIIPTMSMGRTIALLLGAGSAIRIAREVNGATDPRKATPETIRARYGREVKYNAVHSSDSPQAAWREIDLVFRSPK